MTAPGRILIVDDEDDIRAIAQLSLESVGGWEVHAVSSGRDALQAAAEQSFDAVLLDVMMPELDGPSTLAALREAGHIDEVPVVFLTAKTQAAEQAELRAMGAVGVLAKPFDPMTLGDDLAAVLGW